ncbi:MAG: FMN-binding protein [Akkermansiaceae bacterium]|nr:FMN-binding protein [Akkermansiaceae bacterium]
MSCASPSTTKPKRLPSEGRRRLKKWAIACYRLGIILAALACLRALPKAGPSLDPDRLLTEAKSVFPNTASVGNPSEGIYPLLDANGDTPIGWATSNFPQGAKIQGYSGPSEVLVIFDANRAVKAVRFLDSADTAGHVKMVRDDLPFWEQWTGKAESTLGKLQRPRVVSGATITSEAIARGIAARFGAEGMDEWFPEPLKLEWIAKWFPGADAIAETREPGAFHILKGGTTMGTVLRSSRMGVSARGFNGTSDVIVCLDASGGKILGVGFLGSRDNVPYIDDVREEMKYGDGFAGKNVADVMKEDPEQSESLFVSGASVTTYAVIESVHEMLRRHAAEEGKHGFPWKSALAFSWIGLGVVVGLAKWGNKAKIRLGFAVISVAAGVTLGWMVSQDQLVGWGENGFNLRGALPLLVLTAVAMVVPAFTGKNIYCARICPHGAAQTLAGQVIKKRFPLPRKVHAVMERVPWLTLGVIWVLAFLGSGIPFAYFEPFETWSSGFVAFIPAAIFTIGIIGAFFLPQAYCHYGCPTGAMFKFLTHAPGRWTSKDSIAGTLVLASVVLVIIKR